jgi:uncharacterized protein YxjI
VQKGGFCIKFYLKKDKTTSLNKFLIFNHLNREIYKVQSKNCKIGEQLLIFNQLEKVSAIRKLSFPLINIYRISAGAKEIGIIENHIYQINPTYHIIGLNWKFKGSVDPYVFCFTNEKNDIIMTQTRILNDMGEIFELEIFADAFLNICLSVAVCIDSLIRGDKKLPFPSLER